MASNYPELALSYGKLTAEANCAKLYDSKGNHPIILTRTAIQKLLDDLPKAEEIYHQSLKTAEARPDLQTTCFSSELSLAGANKVKLEINLYNGKAYLWVKRFFLSPDDLSIWRPCKGAVALDIKMIAHIVKFLNNHFDV